jgi:cellulose synthase/poly-beta-1,6-N-acetylglucosamine synthase-like glycosyltransferase
MFSMIKVSCSDSLLKGANFQSICSLMLPYYKYYYYALIRNLGEDRWLCTLILKQKYRVEYCAASDAYTHAPEGFNEFYNQRRRWVPSTMANIFDLLSDARRITKINSNISMPYIIYQIILMFGTIIGPGTIFLVKKNH